MRVEIIVQGVVAVLRIEADFDVIALPSVAMQYASYFVAEVSLHFQDQPANPLPAVVGLIGDQLFSKGVHAATRFAAANRTEDRNAGEESALGNRQPPGVSRGGWPTRIVDLAEDYIEVVALTWVRVAWQSARLIWPANFQSKNIEARKQDRIPDERRCVQKEDVGALESPEDRVCSEIHEFEEEVVIGEWHPEIQSHSCCHCEQACEHASGIEYSMDHAASMFSAVAAGSRGTGLLSCGTLRLLIQRWKSASFAIIFLSTRLSNSSALIPMNRARSSSSSLACCV